MTTTTKKAPVSRKPAAAPEPGSPVKSRATKYRVAVRILAVEAGFEFEQLSSTVDRFTKGELVITAHHSAKDFLTRAERSDGKHYDAIVPATQLKIERVKAWIEGADPKNVDRWTLPRSEWDRCESGRGIAKVAVLAEVK